MDSVAFHIGEVARRRGITPKHLRLLEREGRYPRRDYNGRIYPEFDIAQVKCMGIGTRPRRLKRAEEVVR